MNLTQQEIQTLTILAVERELEYRLDTRHGRVPPGKDLEWRLQAAKLAGIIDKLQKQELAA